MNETEALESTTMFFIVLSLLAEYMYILTSRIKWTHAITMPALILGWINALSVKAISETIGVEHTNAAIFGNNTCMN